MEMRNDECGMISQKTLPAARCVLRAALWFSPKHFEAIEQHAHNEGPAVDEHEQ